MRKPTREDLAAAAAAAVGAGVCLVPGTVAAFRTFDFDQRYLVQPGYILKDHCLVQADDDTLHVFYIKADQSLPEGETAKALGHATSLDLKHWTFHPDVIPCVPGTWEGQHIWAPHIVRKQPGAGGPPEYYLFYTGVNHSQAQATGVAVSNDLYHWTKSPSNPVYTPSTAWAAWSDSTYSNCRDPFVFEDGGLWHLLNTAWTQASEGAIAHATSANLYDWTDAGPLAVHPGPQAWHVLESAQLHHVDGKYHLFFNEENVPVTSYLASSALAGPWDVATAEYFDSGRAVEIAPLGSGWILSRHAPMPFLGEPLYTIKFDDLQWNPFSRPSIIFGPTIEDWTRLWGTAFSFQATFWDNTAARGEAACNFGGNSWIGTYERFQGPLRQGQPGDIQGDGPMGAIRTDPFVLSGNRLAFRIAGTPDSANCFLGLYTEADSVLRCAATGPPDSSDVLAERVWDVSAWTDSLVYLAIVDQSATGHLSVDEIREFYAPPVTDVADLAAVLPLAQLHACVPNPFNPRTNFTFDLALPGRARLVVYDVRGRRVRVLVDSRLPGGRHAASWDGRDAAGAPAASGTYVVRLDVNGRPTSSQRATLVK